MSNVRPRNSLTLLPASTLMRITPVPLYKSFASALCAAASLAVAPSTSHAGELTIGQYLAQHQTEFSGQLVNACFEKHAPSAQDLRLAYANYLRSSETAMAKFLTHIGRHASIPAPGAEDSLQRLRASATEFLRTVDLPTYCPLLAARLTTVTPDSMYSGLEQAWQRFQSPSTAAQQSPVNPKP
jgi:hypothetical protein